MNARLDPAGHTRLRTVPDPLPPGEPAAAMPANFLHCAIARAGGGVLSSETFRLVRFEGQEAVSELFDYELELHGNSSLQGGTALEFDDLIGCAVTVGIQRPALHQSTWKGDIGYTNEEMAARFRLALAGGGDFPEFVLFNGIVASFAMEQRGVYRIGMKPAMHRMTLTNNYKVFENASAVEVLGALLKSHGIDASLDALSDLDDPARVRRQHWLQAGESDFDLLRRLLGKVQGYFFFTHDGAGHRLVLANRPAYPPVFPDGRPLRYTSTDAEPLGSSEDDVITRFSYQCAMTSTGVRSVLTRQRACWEDDAILPAYSFAGNSGDDRGTLPFTHYRINQYGGSLDEAEGRAAATGSSMRAAAQVFSGAATCARMRVGHHFSVSGEVANGPAMLSTRPALDGQRFALTHVKLQASADGVYQNAFQATPAAGLIAPFSPQETQQGSVLAVVQPYPDHRTPPDWRYYPSDTSALYTMTLSDAGAETVRAPAVMVRLSTDAPDTPAVLVKLAPHMQTLPEPGVTVLVTRAQDDSELPEIQSIVHGNGTKVVMPSEWTASSHVGSSYSTSYGDGKSIRFGRGQGAPLDFAVQRVTEAYAGGAYRETSYSQGASYSYSCAEARAATPADDGQLFGVAGPGAARDLLSASESFGSTFSRHQGDVVSSWSDIGTSASVSTIGRSTSDSTITGTSTSTTLHKGDVSNTLTVHADSVSSNSHVGDVSSTSTHHGSVDSVTTIFGDQSSVSTIAGTVSSVSTHAIVLSTSTTLDQTSTNTVGVTTSANLTGVATHANVTGVSDATTVTGASSEMSSVGVHSSVSDVGVRDSVSYVGASSTIETKGPGLHVTSEPEQIRTSTSGMEVITIVEIRMYL